MQIRGIIPPVATPMLANEDLDLPRLHWFLDHLISHGVHGVFVLGTNSEFYALDEREKQEVIATAVAHVNRRLPVFAGTGAETTREVVRLTQMAEREGADGVSVITPYFISPTQQEIYDHYRRIAESTSLPVVLYNNPATCGGVKIDVDTVARLAEIPNILAIKDSSGDLQNTNDDSRRPGALFGVDGPRYAHLSGADVRGEGSGAGHGQHRAGAAGGDLQRLPARRPGSVESGATSSQSAAAGVDVVYAAGRSEGGPGHAGRVDWAVSVAGVGTGVGQGVEDARRLGSGGFAAATRLNDASRKRTSPSP